MRLIARLSALCLSSLAASSFAAFVPTGVQVGVSQAQVQNNWGWSVCYSGGGSDNYSLTSLQAQCQGSYLMLAGYVNGSSDYAILAAAERADVLFETGQQTGYGSDVSHTANGSQWYYNDSWSWGFSALGNAVELNSCDINLYTSYGDNTGMCWHTGGGSLNAGWAMNTGNNYQSIYNDFTRVVLVSNGGNNNVPEPTGAALAGVGLLALLASRRRSA